MTSVDARERPGWLSYWLLASADRRAVRRIETTCRSAGDERLDAIALGRLRRAARRERLLPVLSRHSADGLSAADRLARLCSTLRHPSRTGICSGPAAAPQPRTS